MDELQVKNSLVKDAVEARKAQGLEPKQAEIDSYMTGVLNSLARKSSGTPAATKSKDDRVENEFKKMGGKGSFTIDRNPAPILPKVDTTERSYQLLRARMKWMHSKPDYADKVKNISGMLIMGNKGQRERAAERLRELIARSDISYGRSWWREPERKLHFT